MINIVLYQPEIPGNTGNIARTCAATGSTLHLIHPLGFKLDEKSVKRAGLDYWDDLNIVEYDSLEEFLSINQNKDMFFVSTKAQKIYSEIDYTKYDEIFLLFGKETKGLPEELIKDNMKNTIRIPMKEGIRSLNLSNSVAILEYEVLRQIEFDSLETISKYFE